jgi:hypothetical protein
MPTHGFDIASKRREKQVCSRFYLGNAGLLDIERSCDLILGEIQSAPNISKREFFGDKYISSCVDGFPFFLGKLSKHVL